MLRPTLVLFTVLALASAVPAFGQHSDVEFDYQNNQITIQDAEFSGLDADWLFESEFPVDGLSENFSSDPGFASEVAEGLGINPGDDIFLNFIVSPTLGGALQYHDGVGFASTTANISVEDNAPSTPDLVISTGGFSGDNPQFLQTADAAGDIHSHVDFTLSSDAEVGAYGVLLQLQTSSPGIADSVPFWIIFNHGLDEDVFENVVVPSFQIFETNSSSVGSSSHTGA